jgi:hypothetical protein
LIQEEGGQPVEIETERDVLPVEKEPAALP